MFIARPSYLNVGISFRVKWYVCGALAYIALSACKLQCFSARQNWENDIIGEVYLIIAHDHFKCSKVNILIAWSLY